MNPEELARRCDALEQEISRLKLEVDRNDDWANGLFMVLADVLPPFLKAHLEIAARLAPRWKEAAERFDALEVQAGQADDFHETAEKLEPTKMLYQRLDLLRVWPAPGSGSSDASHSNEKTQP